MSFSNHYPNFRSSDDDSETELEDEPVYETEDEEEPPRLKDRDSELDIPADKNITDVVAALLELQNLACPAEPVERVSFFNINYCVF